MARTILTKEDTMPNTTKAKVLSISRLNNSINGNPKYEFVFSGIGIARSASDAGWVYGLSAHSIEGKDVVITHHTTPKGKVIVDSLKEVN
tara:strand:+ start:637 stop:906 length:270 start_codon:yes stop_codon:yes gene_type:complete